MASTHTYIIRDSDIAILAPSNFQLHFIFCVQYVKYFLPFKHQRFQNNEISLWFLYFYDINNLVIVNYLEWKHLLAKLTVKFLKFDNNLVLMSFCEFICFKPIFQAFKMYISYGAYTFTWRYQRIKILAHLHFFLITPAYSALSHWRSWRIQIFIFLLFLWLL